MNILFLTEEPITFSGTMVRGGQIHVRNVVEGLRERGHDVHLVDWNNTSERVYQHSISPGIRYVLDPSRTAVRSISVGREMDVDIVVSKTRKTYLPGIVTARALGVPHVVHVGSSPKSTDDSMAGTFDALSIQARLRAPHDGYFVVCEALRNELAKIGINPKQVHDLKNAVDKERFHPDRVPMRLNAEYRDRIKAFGDGRFLLGYVGGLYSYKGIDDLADAVNRVDVDCGVVVAGDGPEREQLERRFGHDGLFLGPVPYEQVPALYHYFDAFVLPSHTEGLPRVVLEAQATATPVVATRVGGVPEVVRDGETGRLVDPGDPEALAETLDPLLADEAERRRLGENGRAAIETEFSWEALYDRYEQHLAQVLR